MRLTVVLVLVGLLTLWMLPSSGVAVTALLAGIVWLLREAHERRVAGESFTPVFRSLLWAATVLSALVAAGAVALSVLVLRDENGGWAGILLLFTVPLAFCAVGSAFAFAWYARYQPPPATTLTTVTPPTERID